MEYIDLVAEPLLARSGPELRPVARRFAVGFRALPANLLARASRVSVAASAGRVESAGTWSDDALRAELASTLGDLGSALRPRFEWYVCRGAFFHTDAHYPYVMFGVWAVAGAGVDIVLARSAQRVEVEAGTIVIFDPFEVHGVLMRGTDHYDVADYRGASMPSSVFAGFELELNAAVRARFGVDHSIADARIVSSTTRVSAETGRLGD
ncbi:MAG TPA: hypothetical protein VJ501_14355 [Burkholderiaceae bacterium]|nr:hypothetical protein [Burkholderiaceae bacterium]